MNNNLSEIIFILDRSGSMEHLASETIGGFNSLIDKHREEDAGEVLVTTVLFDNRYKIIHDHASIKSVPRLTKKEYYAQGSTALLDAIGRTIDRVGERLSATSEENRPSSVLFVITTDGYENASSEYSKAKVKEMIERQQNVYKWKFLFLGADIDAVGEAASLGIKRSMACQPSATVAGVQSSFDAISKIVDFCIPSFQKELSDEQFEEVCEQSFRCVK